jgi:hypothetical protein
MVSMIPFPSSLVIPRTAELVHFGLPSYSSMTPWMKLALYTSWCCGPISVGNNSTFSVILIQK